MSIYTTIDSPVGRLLLAGDGHTLETLWFLDADGDAASAGIAGVSDPIRDDGAFPEVRAQLDEYFSGARREFELSLSLHGGAFEQRVWAELLRIPYGETISYGELARRIGSPGAARAVGLANGRNPIAVIVPCHRVIGADGRLTGYGGGLPRKRHLLDLEAAG